MNKYRIKPGRNVGELSSKYAYDRDGKQFEADIQASIDKFAADYVALKAFAIERALTPKTLKRLLIKLIEELDV